MTDKYVYIYAEGDFKPNNVNMFGFVISRDIPTEVSDEVSAKLINHPHFRKVGSDKSGLLEASGIAKPAPARSHSDVMKEAWARRKASGQ